MDLLNAALLAARARSAALLSVLTPWVEESSHSLDVAGVNAMGARLAQAFSLPGLTLTQVPGQGGGDHLFWHTPAWARSPRRLVLVGHHDTVHPRGSFEGLAWDGDRLKGPGILDMKGGLAIIHAALGALADVGALADCPLLVASVGDEEVSSMDSAPHLQAQAKGAAAGLVFEAGRAGDRIVTRRKGTGRLVVEAHGRAAHAGNAHEEGRNAIWALARLVDEVQRLTDYARGITVNVGLISGGTGPNTVPAYARFEADFRFERTADAVALEQAVEAAAARLSETSGVTLKVGGGMRRAALEATPESLALMARYAACLEAAGLPSGEAPLSGGGSDANTLAEIGVPAIDGLGPMGRFFHTPDEYVEVSSFAPRVEALVRFLVAW